MECGCEYCEAFQEAVHIKRQQDFYAVQERALAAVKSGVLRIVSGELGWSDVVECDLACASCWARYHLFCETYHGAGGWWRPDEPLMISSDRWFVASSPSPCLW